MHGPHPLDRMPLPEPMVGVRALGRGASDAELIAGAVESHQAWFIDNAMQLDGEVGRLPGLLWTFSPKDRKGVIAFPRLPAECGAQLDAVIAQFRDRNSVEVACWSTLPSRPRGLGARLAARGFEWGWRPHWMALDLQAARWDVPVPDGLRIEVHDAPPDWEGVEIPYYSRPTAQERGRRPGRWYFSGWLDDLPVAFSMLQIHSGRRAVAGIYSVGVAAPARRQGIGAAISLAPCRFARALGFQFATLNAATHIYSRIGFRSLGYGQAFFMHAPALASPSPSAVEVRFAEAVGMGDLKSLDAMDAAGELPPDLDAPLLSRMTPVEMALRPGKARAVRWLGRHGATLSPVDVWEVDGAAAMVALLREHPERIDLRRGQGALTPLHVAVERNDVALVQALLDAGSPDLTARDAWHHGTPHDWARVLGRPEAMALIEAAERRARD